MDNLYNWITLAITILLGLPSAIKGYKYLLRDCPKSNSQPVREGPTTNR